MKIESFIAARADLPSLSWRCRHHICFGGRQDADSIQNSGNILIFADAQPLRQKLWVFRQLPGSRKPAGCGWCECQASSMELSSCDFTIVNFAFRIGKHAPSTSLKVDSFEFCLSPIGSVIFCDTFPFGCSMYRGQVRTESIVHSYRVSVCLPPVEALDQLPDISATISPDEVRYHQNCQNFIETCRLHVLFCSYLLLGNTTNLLRDMHPWSSPVTELSRYRYSSA